MRWGGWEGENIRIDMMVWDMRQPDKSRTGDGRNVLSELQNVAHPSACRPKISVQNGNHYFHEFQYWAGLGTNSNVFFSQRADFVLH